MQWFIVCKQETRNKSVKQYTSQYTYRLSAINWLHSATRKPIGMTQWVFDKELVTNTLGKQFFPTNWINNFKLTKIMDLIKEY